jgi:hypothetical protein
MTPADWKDLFDVIKVALEAVAIVAGGVWAAYTFGSLRQIAKARAEIANTEAARRKTEAELKALDEHARVGAVIEIDLAVTTCRVAQDPRVFLSVLAEVSNRGNRNAQIEYPPHPFKAYAVQVSAQGELSTTLVASAAVLSSVDPSKHSLKLLVRAGGRERLPFLVAVPSPGLYLLVLSLPLPPAEQAIADQYGFIAKGRWSAKRFYTVPPDPVTC